MPLADSASSGAGSVVVTIVLTILAVGVYWLPTIISGIRRLPHTGSVAVMNLFAFVVIPWWLALMMAVRSQPRPQYVVPSGWQPPQQSGGQQLLPGPPVTPRPRPQEPGAARLQPPEGYR